MTFEIDLSYFSFTRGYNFQNGKKAISHLHKDVTIGALFKYNNNDIIIIQEFTQENMVNYGKMGIRKYHKLYIAVKCKVERGRRKGGIRNDHLRHRGTQRLGYLVDFSR